MKFTANVTLISINPEINVKNNDSKSEFLRGTCKINEITKVPEGFELEDFAALKGKTTFCNFTLKNSGGKTKTAPELGANLVGNCELLDDKLFVEIGSTVVDTTEVIGLLAKIIAKSSTPI